ncbi:hypothetical protein C3L33_13461, partial [Rhododendron williamsianum]
GKYEQEYERLDTFQQQLKLKISEEEGRLKKDEEEKKRKCEHEEQWVPSRRRRATKGYQKKVSFIPKSEAVSHLLSIADCRGLQQYLPVHVEEAFHLREIEYAGRK